MLYARMQPNLVDVVRIKVVFIQNCAHARLHVYGAVRRNRAASDGDALSVGRHPTTNTGERDDADDECRRIEKGYVSVAYGPQMSTRARSQRCGGGVLTFEPSELAL